MSNYCNLRLLNLSILCLLINLLTASSSLSKSKQLGENEALRVYVEFADGKNRGIYDPESDKNGFPDEDYDATTAMVINWHKMPEKNDFQNARIRYRKVYPFETDWLTKEGDFFEFWYRDEIICRVLLNNLNANSLYEFQVKENGEIFRFRTMPESLDDRAVKIALTADHQSPNWSEIAHDNAKIVSINKPDMFVVVGDYINDEGMITEENANRWATYLDMLYGINKGYFLYDKVIEESIYENLIIPHVTVLGNHETGQRNHMRWPADFYSPEGPDYPMFIPANWIELLFHWPYKSEGFLSEFNPNHPNIDPDHMKENFGHGGFGKLSFSDYLLFIALDNSQNWEGEPERNLRDRDGYLITDRWPWFENLHADIRQDEWLKNLLEPEGKKTAGESYDYILPVWHRGLFGTGRLNMSYKNRGLLKYWLPILYRNNAKLIKEAHDHNFTRTVPMGIYEEKPENTYLEKVTYNPHTWELTDQFDEKYLEENFTVNVLKDNDTHEIVGWEYGGNYITYFQDGMITIGHGGWAAGRRNPGQWGGGNAGLWFVDESKGGETFGGEESYHMTFIQLTNEELHVEAYHPRQLHNFLYGEEPVPIHRFKWVKQEEKWYAYDVDKMEWGQYKKYD
jgi:hypothetical protein